MLVTLTVIAIAFAALAFLFAVSARRSSARVVAECAEMMRHQLRSAEGGADDRAIRDLAVVHYDALKEVAGGLSFSLALLNAVGDGVVLTSINGRTETRTYAKVVQHGRSLQLLSPEEERAVRAARLGQGPMIRLDAGLRPGPDDVVNGRSPTSA